MCNKGETSGLKLQKKKLERLQQSRLPDDILDDVASRPKVTVSTVPEETKQTPPEDEPIESG